MYEIAVEIVSIIQHQGYDAYLVGGWVRDTYLIGDTCLVDDIDIATNAPAEKIISLFENTKMVGSNYGVIFVIYKKVHFEISTFRLESNYIDGRHPSIIIPGTLYDDAHRRDFTINGMFYDPISSELIDIVGGLDDIKNKKIRCIGDPYKRFREDRLRMIRCVRFAIKFGFTIAKNTGDAIIDNSHMLFPSVSKERIWNELCKFSSLKYGFMKLHQYNLLQQIFPSLSDKDIKLLSYPIDNYPIETPTILKIMALFPDINDYHEICDILKVSKRDMIWCKKLINLKTFLFQKSITLTQWCYLYADSDTELLLKIVSEHQKNKKSFLSEHKRRQSTLNSHIKRIIESKPLVTSQMLIDRGIIKGPKLGQLMKKAEHISIDMDINDPNKILDIILV